MQTHTISSQGQSSGIQEPTLLNPVLIPDRVAKLKRLSETAHQVLSQSPLSLEQRMPLTLFLIKSTQFLAQLQALIRSGEAGPDLAQLSIDLGALQPLLLSAQAVNNQVELHPDKCAIFDLSLREMNRFVTQLGLSEPSWFPAEPPVDLDFSSTPSISDEEALIRLREVKGAIKSLNFSGCYNLSDAMIRKFGKRCVELRVLGLQNTAVSLETLHAFAPRCHKNMDILALGSIPITDECLDLFVGSWTRGPRKLSLRNTMISKGALMKFTERFPETLVHDHSDNSEMPLRPFPGAASFLANSVRRLPPSFDDKVVCDSLAYQGDFCIDYLNLSNRGSLSERVLIDLAKRCRKLKVLRLSGTQTTDSVLNFFVIKFEDLQFLDVRETRVSGEMVAEIRQRFPNATVLATPLSMGSSSSSTMNFSEPPTKIGFRSVQEGRSVTDAEALVLLRAITGTVDSLNLSGCDNISDKMIREFSLRCEGLKDLRLSMAPVTLETLYQLATKCHESMDMLDLTSTPLTDDCLELFASRWKEGPKSLRLGDTKISRGLISKIAERFPKIYIYPDRDKFGRTGTSFLAPLAEGPYKAKLREFGYDHWIEVLDLSGQQMSDADLSGLALSCQNLRSLTLTHVPISDARFRHFVSKFGDLQYLNVVGSGISNEMLVEIRQCYPSATILPEPAIASSSSCSSSVPSPSPVFFVQMDYSQETWGYATKIAEEEVRQRLKECRGFIEYLDLGGQNIPELSDATIREISQKCSHLKVLDLSGTPVKLDTLYEFSQRCDPSMKALVLNFTPIDDQCLEQFASQWQEGPDWLGLLGTGISSVGLARIRERFPETCLIVPSSLWGAKPEEETIDVESFSLSRFDRIPSSFTDQDVLKVIQEHKKGRVFLVDDLDLSGAGELNAFMFEQLALMCHKLHSLNLAGTQTSDANLRFFASRFEKLRFLDVTGTSVSSELLQSIRQRFPEAIILPAQSGGSSV